MTQQASSGFTWVDSKWNPESETSFKNQRHVRSDKLKDSGGGGSESPADSPSRSLQFRWPICEAPAGIKAAAYVCVPAERSGYLLQLSGVHLERQLIQGGVERRRGWRRLASSLIPLATNSIICSLLVSVSLSPSLSPSSRGPPTSPSHFLFYTICCFFSWEILLFFILYNHVSYFIRADSSLSGEKKPLFNLGIRNAVLKNHTHPLLWNFEKWGAMILEDKSSVILNCTRLQQMELQVKLK